MHYGDDWKRVAQHVGGRTEKDCIAHFIKLPFGEEFLNYQYSGVSGDKDNQLEEPADDDSGVQSIGAAEPSKRMRLTPLADASNPILAQVLFLVQVKNFRSNCRVYVKNMKIEIHIGPIVCRFVLSKYQIKSWTFVLYVSFVIGSIGLTFENYLSLPVLLKFSR